MFLGFSTLSCIVIKYFYVFYYLDYVCAKTYTLLFLTFLFHLYLLLYPCVFICYSLFMFSSSSFFFLNILYFFIDLYSINLHYLSFLVIIFTIFQHFSSFLYNTFFIFLLYNFCICSLLNFTTISICVCPNTNIIR